MLTKDELMKLSKERLCELLLEEWSKKENTLKPFEFPSFGRDDCGLCFHGGQCTNPYHDCINCPRRFSDNGTTISTDCEVESKSPNCSPMLYGAINYTKREVIVKELERLYNSLGIDDEMSTSDYLLAEYTLNCLIAYGNAMNKNKEKGYIKSTFED